MKMYCYPSCMVPYTGLKTNVKVDNLIHIGDFAIARRSDRPYSDKDIKQIGDDYIVRADSDLREDPNLFKRVPDFSMTMLRHDYPICYAKYDLKMKSPEDDWTGGRVKPCKLKGRAKMIGDCYLMVYLATNLHNQPVQYQRKFEKKEDAKTVEDFYEDLKDALVHNRFTKKTFYMATGQILLKHSPTLLNYWHYELKLKTSEGEFVNTAKYKSDTAPGQLNYRESFVTYVLDNYLFKHFWVDKNPCKTDIPLSCFYDDRVNIVERWAANIMNNILFASIPIAI